MPPAVGGGRKKDVVEEEVLDTKDSTLQFHPVPHDLCPNGLLRSLR